MMPETGETITRRPRRNHSPGFKVKVALAAIKGEKSLAELAEQCDVHAKIGELTLTNDASQSHGSLLR